ncbi:MAG TPA: hypothetical protein VD930_06895 [Gemmatimonadales bacterium]|nr:hypothetical protein [Gemmatimonadales bacterium]
MLESAGLSRYGLASTRTGGITMLALLRYPALLLLTVLAACRTNPGSTDPSNQTRARIENRSSLDMDINVRRNDGRDFRLGFAPGNETTTFALPATITAGAAWVRFEARPVRGSGSALVSEPFPVQIGSEIAWSVPPQ